MITVLGRQAASCGDPRGQVEAVDLGHVGVDQHQRNGRPAAARLAQQRQRLGRPDGVARGRMLPVAEHLGEDRRLVALSSTTSTGRPCSSIERRRALGDARRLRPSCRPSPKRAVKWNVLPRPTLALDPDPPAHQLDQPRRDGQPQARAAEAPRGRGVGLLEGLEDARPACRRGMPMPVSRTAKCSVDAVAVGAAGSACRSTSSTTSPRSVNLIALPTRLTTTCRSRPRIADQSVGHVGGDVVRPAPGPWRAPAARATSSCRPAARGGRSGIASRSSLPASIFEKSRMSLITHQERLARLADHLQVLALLGREARVQHQARSCR